jgi:hypothetical protein
MTPTFEAGLSSNKNLPTSDIMTVEPGSGFQLSPHALDHSIDMPPVVDPISMLAP